ncbi:MAG: oxygen-dependent coproporphyrinogen oxidase [Planctomycetes bacterium]|nr:oxygen-dependent coproporphyrinogen oxidase [Planctomycetota bacterium]
MSSSIDFDELVRQASGYFRQLQDHICAGLEELERSGGGAARFREDPWQYPSGGGGVTRVMLDGTVFEKAGVNFSHVNGSFTEEMAATMPGPGTGFTATGISLVIHPRNPHVPTVHANFRHISKGTGNGQAAWFGGGSDLTPYYPRREDVIHFHRTWKAVCDRHPVADHARFKKWCDDYFYLPHRGEARGVGGIFFDYLRERLHEVFAFVRDAGDQFLPAYQPIVERRLAEPFTDQQSRWQLIRRGRYVEFNLLYDRGTTFGLKTGGRVESILMSLPLHVMWGYNETPQPGSPEAELLDYLQPRDWAAESTGYFQCPPRDSNAEPTD